MADPVDPRSKYRWLWPVVLVLLAVLLILVLFNPSGNREGEVNDPIVTGEVADPAAEAGAGPVGPGLPEENGVAIDPDAPGADVTVERQPTDGPVPAPSPAWPIPPESEARE